MRLFITLLTIIIFSALPVRAEDVYQTPDSFVMESFSGQPPAPETLKPDEALKNKISKIMGSYYKLPNLEYWKDNNRTVWILEDIGKYQPITTGFVVGNDNTLERVKVLIYRESHGWEVKHDFFTRQFKNAGLKKERKLDKRIDGISGATLSVNALKRLSALALLLHQEVTHHGT